MTVARLAPLAIAYLLGGPVRAAVPSPVPERGQPAGNRSLDVPLPGGRRAHIHPLRGGVAAPAKAAPDGSIAGPSRSPDQSTVSVTPPAVLPHLDYYGGKVLANVSVVPVFWGRGVAPATVSKMGAFYGAFVASPLYSWLNEYDTTRKTIGGTDGTQQHIGAGSVIGSGVTIDPSNTSLLITDAALVAELSAQITAGHLPPNGANTIYMVHFPPGLTIALDAFNRSCESFCAYHSTDVLAGQNLYYGVIPDMGASSNCVAPHCGDGIELENLSNSASHELVEAVTDPEVGLTTNIIGPPLAWYDGLPVDLGNAHQEIGDICAALPQESVPFIVGADTFAVQKEWSNQLGACVGNPADNFPITVTPATVKITQFGTQNFTISTGTPATGAVAVQLLASSAPQGVNARLTTSKITTGQSTVLSVDVSRGTRTPFTLTVLGFSALATPFAQLGVTADDFTATPASPTLSLAAGSNSSMTIDTLATPGSDPQQVTFQLQSAPAGFSASFTPNPIGTGQSTTMTLSAAPGSASSTSRLSVVATSPLQLHAVTVTAQVAGDDFTLAFDNPQPLVEVGSSATLHVITAVTHGNPVNISLSARDLPRGVTASFSPTSIRTGQSTALKLNAGSGAVVGVSHFTVVATGPGGQQTGASSLLVRNAGCASAGPELAFLALPLLYSLRRRRPTL